MNRRARFAALIAALLVIVGCGWFTGTSQAVTGQTIFGGQTSGINTDPDTSKSTIGTQFRVAQAGTVDAVRVHRSSQITGALTGKLSRGSTVLATVSLPAAGAGWQEVGLLSPVSVVTGQTYTVYYTAPAGRYSVKSQFAWPKVSGDLTAVRGVYTFGNGVPTSVYQNENYFVDVVFNPTPPTTSASASPTTTTAEPTTTAPPITEPTTTPVTTSEPTTTTSATTTSPPAVVNCAPNPSACGFPDATNTGARGALRKVPEDVTSGPGWTWRGTYLEAQTGAMVENLELSGADVNIVGDNVTVRNVKINGYGEGWGIAIRHATNTLIEDTTIVPTPGQERLMVGIKDIYADSQGTMIRRVDISGTSTGVQMESGTLRDSYIHDLGYKDGDHLNGFTSNGGADLLTIQHNTIFNQVGQTDAVSLFQDFAAQRNRLIHDNLLAGGGYTIYGGANPGKESSATGVQITNNRISRMYFPQGGSYGWLAAWNPNGAGNVLTGNVWDDTGETLGP